MLDSAFCGGGGACEGGGGGAPPGTNAAADADGFHSPALGFILSFKGLGLLVLEMISKMSSFRTKARILSYTWKTHTIVSSHIHIHIVLIFMYHDIDNVLRHLLYRNCTTEFVNEPQPLLGGGVGYRTST